MKSALVGRFLVLQLTKSRIQHIKCHPITLFRSCDGHKSLVTVVLGLVNLDDTSTDGTYLINLGATLANDRANHIVWNEDLLG